MNIYEFRSSIEFLVPAVWNAIHQWLLSKQNSETLFVLRERLNKHVHTLYYIIYNCTASHSPASLILIVITRLVLRLAFHLDTFIRYIVYDMGDMQMDANTHGLCESCIRPLCYAIHTRAWAMSLSVRVCIESFWQQNRRRAQQLHILHTINGWTDGDWI